jgi:Zn-dependent peptidase ImmA (M78 family)
MVQLVHRLAQVLDEHAGLPERDIPGIPTDPYQSDEERRAAAEAAAEKVRRVWKLPRGPVSNVVETLESHGIVCVRLAVDDARIDAFSVNFEDHPIAVLGTDKDKWDRSRFDAAHELGHLVMHEEAAGVAEAEKQANEFAAAFLMPAGDIRGALPPKADWALLMNLKRQWGVSIAALLMRAKTLRIMDEAAYLSAAKIMSARGWRKHEPVNGVPETPSLLASAIKRANRRGTDITEIRSETAIPDDLFDQICDFVSA